MEQLIRAVTTRNSWPPRHEALVFSGRERSRHKSLGAGPRSVRECLHDDVDMVKDKKLQKSARTSRTISGGPGRVAGVARSSSGRGGRGGGGGVAECGRLTTQFRHFQQQGRPGGAGAGAARHRAAGHWGDFAMSTFLQPGPAPKHTRPPASLAPEQRDEVKLINKQN